VVLVHGLLMSGLDLTLLARRLRRCGFATRIFSYASVRGDIDDSVERLYRFITAQRPRTLHLVGHSLGGLLIRLLLERHPELPPGRVVTLGTPHNGSVVARRLWRRRWGRRLIGGSAATLAGAVPPWRGARPLGSIAGRLPLGVGVFMHGLPRPNDGTVAVAETQLDGMDDHMVLPLSHMALVVSAASARQTCRFLRTGRFEHAVTTSAD